MPVPRKPVAEWQASSTATSRAPVSRIACIFTCNSSSMIEFSTAPTAPCHLSLSEGRMISS